jgi:hypothetical protein
LAGHFLCCQYQSGYFKLPSFLAYLLANVRRVDPHMPAKVLWLPLLKVASSKCLS